MNPTSEQGPRILIGFDDSEGARAAVRSLARAGLPPRASALVVTVAEPVGLPPTVYLSNPVDGSAMAPYYADAVRRATDEEAKWAASVGAKGVRLVSELFPQWQVRTASPIGVPYATIIEQARQCRAGLIVVGAHSRPAVGRFLFGSVAYNVLTHAHCSVRVGRNGHGGREGVRILLGVDGSPDAAAAVAAVCSRRWPPGSEVRVATVIDTRVAVSLASMMQSRTGSAKLSPVHSLVESVGDRLRDSSLEFSTVILEGNPKEALALEAEQWQAECVFVGARGHSRLERFLLGSVSAALAARASCSVEVVRQATVQV
jgi:nucleotide-binding universal stress UspA family protein